MTLENAIRWQINREKKADEMIMKYKSALRAGVTIGDAKAIIQAIEKWEKEKAEAQAILEVLDMIADKEVQ